MSGRRDFQRPLPVKFAASWASVCALGASVRILATAASWSGSAEGHACCIRAGVTWGLVAASDFSSLPTELRPESPSPAMDVWVALGAWNSGRSHLT